MPSLRRPRRSAPAGITERDEAFRVLRSNLLVATSELANPIVVVTSAREGEGKTSTCVSLAKSLAMAGPRVVLVDLDLRKPDAHHRIGADNVPGCVDVLLDRRRLDECLQFFEPPIDLPTAKGLYFLPAGEGASDPAELLGSPRAGKMLDALARQADIVLLDTPPVLPVADTLVVGRLAAGAVLVVEAHATPAPAVLRAKDALIRNQTRLLGVVLNKQQAIGGDYSYGYGLSTT